MPPSHPSLHRRLPQASLSETHPILSSSYSQQPRVYPSPPTSEQFTLVSEGDTRAHYRDRRRLQGDGQQSAQAGSSSGHSVLSLAGAVELPAGAHDRHSTAVDSRFAGPTDLGGPDDEWESSDDEVCTPDISWSASSGNREATFKKRSPGDVPIDPSDGVLGSTAFRSRSGVNVVAVEPPLQGGVGHGNRFVPAAASHRRATLDALRNASLGESQHPHTQP